MNLNINTIPFTQLLYNADPYQRQATSSVIAIDGDDVVLSATLCYPEGGGQAADRGWLNGHEITALRRERVQFQQAEHGSSVAVASVIVHTVPGHDCTVGDVVSSTLDWDWRYANMKMHTLAHLLFIATSEFLAGQGLPVATKGCQIEGRSARFDFRADIAAEALPGIQQRVQQLADSGTDAHVVETADGIRLWQAAGFVIPCGGTHVRSMREIDGEITVRRRRKGSGLTRLYVSREE
ncbi:alanyl-tRNA editing protein [uncultured Propionibacterium sp.]|uniref:alanyl-tRNA editing protein n=1 Tax=uncultured Propionibacterium sp. TaxID=218066 RepID=UPI002931856E|nr:alanyl-tRNA editing protein [uncultured Propionibacterium sp.]